MTSAPKSDRIVVAAGPAMKLATSRTFRPVKMWLTAVICSSPLRSCRRDGRAVPGCCRCHGQGRHEELDQQRPCELRPALFAFFSERIISNGPGRADCCMDIAFRFGCGGNGSKFLETGPERLERSCVQ